MKFLIGSFFIGLSLIFFTDTGSESLSSFKRASNPVLIPPQQLEHFTFGYSDMIADILWLRSLQAFDFCGETFVGHEVTYGSRTVNLCQKGWVFQMLDAVTRIAPRYRIVYVRGAVGLSVIVNDRDGADELYTRGIKAFPAEWVIYFQAAYHKLAEMNQPLLAAEYMQQAGRYGAPNWATLLAAKLYDQAGRAEFGLRALVSFYGDLPLEQWPERAHERWDELEKSLGRKATPEEFKAPIAQ